MIPHSRRFRLFALVVIGVALTAGGLAARVARAQSALQVLHTFAGDPDGASPGALIQGVDGNFYGTTRMGGDSSNGTAFQMTPDGTVSILHSFADGPDDGKEPEGALIQASDGDFYGTTAKGGTFGQGTVYRMTADGSVTLLYSFAGEPDGSTPLGGLLQATDGNLYGTTYWGGAFSNGTAFRIAPNGSGYAVLHDFARGVDGAWPVASLVQATDGNFYGTTSAGGAGMGVVFRFSLTPSGTWHAARWRHRSSPPVWRQTGPVPAGLSSKPRPARFTGRPGAALRVSATARSFS